MALTSTRSWLPGRPIRAPLHHPASPEEPNCSWCIPPGPLRLSVVFAPVFSAQQQNGSILPVGSIGQMIELGQQDKQDNVLLELIVAREFHIMGQKCKSKALMPCSCILPLFRNECVWDASLQLPNSPSAKTNQKALHMMQLIGLEALASEELRNGSLTVADVRRLVIFLPISGCQALRPWLRKVPDGGCCANHTQRCQRCHVGVYISR